MTIFDEAHRLKNRESQNSELALGCYSSGIPIMLLSATLADSPLDLYTTGLILGLHEGGQDFIRWATEHGCTFDGMGLTYRAGPGSMVELHQHLFPRHGSRLRGQDLKSFPESLVIAKPLDIENPEGLQAIYDDMQEEMDRHAEKVEGDGMKALNMLCQLTRARQHAELLKVPAMVELVDDLVAQGHSVPIFVNYSETLRALQLRLASLVGPSSVVIGGQLRAERDMQVARFQNGNVKIILCQIQAGGESISLHDLHGGHPRASVISPGFDARAVIQACGRTPRAGAKTKCLQYVIFARGTIEEAACRAIARKASNIESLNDGDLAAGFFPSFKK